MSAPVDRGERYRTGPTAVLEHFYSVSDLLALPSLS